MKPLFASLLLAFVASAAAAAGDTIAVLDFRSRNHPIAAADLTDRVRDVVRRVLPDARVIDREDDADLIVSGRVFHGGIGYRASLELRDRSGTLLQTATATAGTRRELEEAVEGAAGDLFRARQEASAARSLPAGAVKLPEVPARPELPDDALDVDADTRVLVAYDRARKAEAQGRQYPEQAAAAWRRLSFLGGHNPFREIARTRAQQWESYAEGRRAADVQMARDTTRLRDVLPLSSVNDATKVELLVRYASTYGFDQVSPLVALLPTAGLRQRAELSLDCEVKEAHACVQLARAADEAKDGKAALDYLDRACGAGSAESCAEAGDRWLQPETRDPPRAIPALQRGCDAGNAAACVRLARVYEEGDGAAPSASTANDLREKACNAGDGKSCRRLAGITDAPGRVADLLKKGCDGGDSVSCALAAKESSIVRRELQDAAMATRKGAVLAPARAVEKPVEKAPSPSLPKTEVTPRKQDSSVAGAMVAFGALAGIGTAIVATGGGDPGTLSHSRRALVAQTPQSNGLRTVLTIGMGTAAVLSTGAGIALLFSSHGKKDASKVGVGVAPGEVVVSGTFH